ncbi:MAG: hypothetical protein EA377_13865, partial [Phycisphaerales bacterium]
MDLWTGIFITTSAICAAFALWGMLSERIVPHSRRMRRCLKCRYDMSHTPGLRCSECGWTAKRKNQFFAGRTRWRWIVAAGLLAAAIYTVYITPHVR